MFLKYNKRLIGVLSLLLLISHFIFHSQVLAEEFLTIGGVGSALRNMRLISDAFERSSQGIKIRVIPSLGSTGGIKAVLSGTVDIGLSGRPLKEEESRRGAVETEYAMTPFVFVTNKANAISGLSTKYLVEIYEGKRQSWPDGTPIRLVLRPAADADTGILENISPEMNHAVQKALSRQGMIMAVTNQESDTAVEKTPGSLGASTLTQVISEGRSLKMLALDGVSPSTENLVQGNYPLFKRFFIVTKQKPSPTVRKFMDFIKSGKGRKLLEKTGNVVIDRPSSSRYPANNRRMK